VKYDVTEAAISEMASLYMDLNVADVEDQKGFEEVELARKTVKGKRIAVEKQRKVFKSDALIFGRLVDSKAKEIFALLEPIESHLTKEGDKIRDEEKRIKAEAEAKEKAKIQERVDALMKIDIVLDFFTVATMSDEDYANFYAKSEEAWAAEQARIAEDARIEAEKKEAYRIAQEKKEADLKAEAERQEAVRKEQDAKAAALKVAHDKLVAAEKAIQDKKDREALEKRLEEEATAKAEKEAQEEAEWQADLKRNTEIEAQRQKELLPDKEKLLLFADEIKDLTAGNLSVESEGARELFHDVLGELANVEALLRAQIEEL